MPPQPPVQPQPQTRCACGEDFRRALRLLCGPRLQPLVNFNAFAFVTEHYILGSALEALTSGTGAKDNLAGPAASYVCGGDSCEALTVSGLLYPPQAGGTALESTVTQVALCRLHAIAVDAVDAAAFQTLTQALSQQLRPQRPQDCPDLAGALTSAAAVRTSTVTTGALVVENSTILGQQGSVLVMANSADNRIYFICADQIDFMG